MDGGSSDGSNEESGEGEQEGQEGQKSALPNDSTSTAVVVKPKRGLGGFDSGPANLPDKAKITGGKQVAVRGIWAQFAISTGNYYYLNTTTGETTWALPAGFKTVTSRRAGDAPPGQPSSLKEKIFIFNVPPGWDEARLKQQFAHFGRITACLCQRDTSGQRNTHTSPLGGGFVTYSNESEALAAIRTMNGFFVDGMRLRVATSRY